MGIKVSQRAIVATHHGIGIQIRRAGEGQSGEKEGEEGGKGV